jgi:hypothetical protein
MKLHKNMVCGRELAVKENWKMELSIISIKLGEIELTRINGS